MKQYGGKVLARVGATRSWKGLKPSIASWSLNFRHSAGSGVLRVGRGIAEAAAFPKPGGGVVELVSWTAADATEVAVVDGSRSVRL